MTYEESIEITLEQKLKAEKLRRVIQECDDIFVVKQIAIELLHINQQNNIRRIYNIYMCVLVVQIHFFKEEQEAHVVKEVM